MLPDPALGGRWWRAEQQRCRVSREQRREFFLSAWSCRARHDGALVRSGWHLDLRCCYETEKALRFGAVLWCRGRRRSPH